MTTPGAWPGYRPKACAPVQDRFSAAAVRARYQKAAGV